MSLSICACFSSIWFPLLGRDRLIGVLTSLRRWSFRPRRPRPANRVQSTAATAKRRLAISGAVAHIVFVPRRLGFSRRGIVLFSITDCWFHTLFRSLFSLRFSSSYQPRRLPNHPCRRRLSWTPWLSTPVERMNTGNKFVQVWISCLLVLVPLDPPNKSSEIRWIALPRWWIAMPRSSTS